MKMIKLRPRYVLDSGKKINVGKFVFIKPFFEIEKKGYPTLDYIFY